MIPIPRGKILTAVDHGTIWQLWYEKDGNGVDTINFDHRPFAHFYEGATSRSFYKDYRFGAGREYVSKQLEGLRIEYDGDTVRLEE